MKTTLKYISITTLSILYCIITCLCIGNTFASNTTFSPPNNLITQSHQSTFSDTIFYHTAQAENVICISNNIPSASIKYSFKNNADGIKVAAQLFLHTFYQYSFYSKNEIARLQRTDIIYPFHYFW